MIQEKDKIHYSIDPRTELLGIIQYLAGDHQTDLEYYQKEYKEYYQIIDNYFSKYKNHETVLMFNKLLNEDNIFFGNSFILNYDKDITSIINKDNNYDICLKYLPYLKKFIEDTNYFIFFNQNKTLFERILNNNLNNIESNTFVEDYHNFYNEEEVTIRVIFKLVQSDWGESVSNTEDNKIIINNICGVSSMKNNLPLFITSNKQLQSLIFHESTHPIVAKHIKPYIQDIIDTEDIFINNVLTYNFIQDNYPFYNVYLEESITRSLTLLIMHKYNYLSDEEMNKSINEEEELGFIYNRIIMDIFKDYSTKTKSFEECLNELFNYLKSININTKKK